MPKILFHLFTLFTAILFGSATISQAQSPVIFNYSGQQTFFVQFEPTSSKHHHISNLIIRDLARGLRQRPDQTGFAFRLKYDIKLVRRRNILTTHIDLHDFRFSGDTRYMGFEVSDVLMPDRVDMIVQLYDGNTLVHKVEVQSSGLNIKRNPITIDFADTIKYSPNLNVEISQMMFHYNTSNRVAFINRLALIDQYFAWDVSLDQMTRVLHGLDPNNLDFLRENQHQLKQIFSGITQIKENDFYNTLELWS